MMTEPVEGASLKIRLDRLEKRYERLKLVCFSLALLVGTLFLVGAQAPKAETLEGEKLVLRDGQGCVRAELNGNGPYLKLFDQKGKVRAELFSDHLKLFDDKQVPRAEVFASHIKIFSDKGITRAELFGDHLKLFDDSEVAQVELNGSPSLTMFREKKPVYSAP